MSAELRVTYLRCSMTLVQWQGINLLTDPWYGRQLRGLPCFYQPPLELAALPQIHAVLISHLHPDHFDCRAIHRLVQRDPGAQLLAPPDAAYALGPRCGCQTLELRGGEGQRIGPLKVQAIEALHSGYELNFMIQGPDGMLFFGGDARYGPAFAQAAGRVGRPDVALLPIGGTLVLGRRIVMNPQDAAKAADDLGARYVIPIHEGGIWLSVPPLSLHPGRPEQLAALLERTGSNARCVTLKPGAAARFAASDQGLTLIS